MKNMIKQESVRPSRPAAPVIATKDLEIWEEISALTAEIQRDEAVIAELKEQYEYQDYFPDYEYRKGAEWLHDMTVIYSANALATEKLEEILEDINELNWDLICACVSADNREIDLEAFALQNTPLAKAFSENERKLFGLTEIQKHEIHQCVFKDTVELMTKDNHSHLKQLSYIQEGTETPLLRFAYGWKPQRVLGAVSFQEIESAVNRSRRVDWFMISSYEELDNLERCRKKLIPLLEEVQVSGGVQ